MDSFKELARARRSHRIYTDEPVSDEYVRTILRAALMSPTAKGLRNGGSRSPTIRRRSRIWPASERPAHSFWLALRW